jgi:hypothetical protein
MARTQAAGDRGLLERLAEQPLGPDELHREHREPGRDQHERRPGRDEHDHPAEGDQRAGDPERDAEQRMAVAVRRPLRLEPLDQLGSRTRRRCHRHECAKPNQRGHDPSVASGE